MKRDLEPDAEGTGAAAQDSAETAAAQALGCIDATTRAIVPPVQPATTFHRESYDTGPVYGRVDNPAYDQVEAVIARLEDGAGARVFASGMAAAACAIQSLPRGTHVIAPRQMYFELRKWLVERAPRLGIDVDFVDAVTPETVRSHLRRGVTGMIWIETPSNPLWEVTDIAAVAELAHEAGAAVLVDSTSASPVLTRPLSLGADLVLHSASKYLNGHSDVVAGALVTALLDERWAEIGALRQSNGGVLGAFEAWLLLRGMRTLFLRVRAASDSALAIATHLSAHPQVTAVYYPGLPTHAQHEIAARQMRGGFGGMLSFRVRGGEQRAIDVSAATRLFMRATSLGGVESLIEHRASVESAASGVPRDLLRLSVGIERTEDLLADLDRALASSASPP